MKRTTVILAEPYYTDIDYVMHRLRHYDHIEASATSHSDNPEDWARLIAGAGAFQWAAYWGEFPVAVFGAMERWPGVWSGWCLGTDNFPHVALSVSRFIKWVMVPALFDAGMNRLDAYALQDYAVTHRWLRMLGASPEVALENWGKNGETFVSYVWLREATKPTDRTTVADMGLTHGLPV